MGQEEWVRALSDVELATIALELEERAELFAQSTRTLVNDELRRRKMPPLGMCKARH